MPTPIAVAPPIAAPAAVKPVAPTAAPVAEAEPTFEVTVDGKAAKLTRKQLERYAGKGAFADKLMQQAKEALRTTQTEREERETLKKRIKEDKGAREAWMREHGLDPDEYARERLGDKLREHEMTPEQKRIAELEAKQADSDKKLKAVEEEKQQQALTVRAQRIQKHVEGELAGAWERAGFTNGDSDAFHAVYKVMAEWNDLGLLPKGEEFTAAFADRVIEAAKENIEGAFKTLETAALKGLKGKALFDRIPKAVRDELNRYQLELIRGGGGKAPGVVPAARAQPVEEFISPQEAMKKMRGAG